MAKKNNSAAVATNENGETVTPEVKSGVSTPEGFEDVSADIVAMYDYKTTPELYVRPLNYTVSDSKDKKKPAILIHCDLLKPATLLPMGDDETDAREFPTGSRIGIWYRPGLRELMQCAGAITYVAFAGDKDVGQILPMKTFKVSRKKGEKAGDVTMLSDYRKLTRHMPLPWEDPSAPRAVKSGGGEPAYDYDTDGAF